MNSSPSSVRIQAKSLEQALVKAAGSLGVTQDEVGYEIVKEDTAKGLFSFFKTSVVEIKAWNRKDEPAASGRRSGQRSDRRPSNGRRPSNERRSETSRSPAREESLEPRSELTPAQVDELVEELRQFCLGICSRVADDDVKVSAEVEEGRLVLNIHSDYMSDQIMKNTKLAEAMEHILRKKPRHLKQELPFRIFVDVSGHRKSREHELVQMAQDLSSKVHENKRPIVLNYKSSYDRKIIHMALDKDDRVYTKSIGSGPNRKLMILPVKEAGQAAEQA